jgi:hypothetical protein
VAEIKDEIAEIEEDIEAIKTANSDWVNDAGDTAAIAAKCSHLAGLETRLAAGRVRCCCSLHPLLFPPTHSL